LTIPAQSEAGDFKFWIVGQVLDLENRPVPQAAVYAHSAVPEQIETPPCALADNEGKFSIQIERPGKYMLSAYQEKEGYADTWVTVFGPSVVPLPEVVVEEGLTQQSVVIHLGPKAGKLFGHVIDAETNLPMESSAIELRQETAQSTFIMHSPCYKGQFQLLVPTTPFTLKVSAAGYCDWNGSSGTKESTLFLIGSGDVQELEILLHPTKDTH
jgi:hypothetical protein